MTCCTTCRRAKPDGKCTCSCGGRFHGVDHESYVEYPYHTVNKNLGGEAGKFIIKYTGVRMKCTCGKEYPLMGWLGYEHENGLKDENGTGWWIFWKCPHCHYQWAFHKIPVRLNNMKDQQIKLFFGRK